MPYNILEKSEDKSTEEETEIFLTVMFFGVILTGFCLLSFFPCHKHILFSCFVVNEAEEFQRPSFIDSRICK